MSEIQLRLPLDFVGKLRSELSQFSSDHEPVVFGLVTHASTAGTHLVLVREIVIPPADAFLPSEGHGAKWSGAFSVEVLNRALAGNFGIFIFHSHGDVNPVRMSSDDRASASSLLPKFQQIAPSRPHGSIVLGDRAVAGMILMPGSRRIVESFSTRFFEHGMLTVPQFGTTEEIQLLRRQPLTANPAAAKILADATVAVVGLSGGGSQVVPQLAGLGIGTIIGVDPQRVHRSNRYSTSRVGWADALLRRAKTRVMAGAVWWIDRTVRFIGVPSLFPEAPTVAALRRADIIIGCVNNLHARADLMELAWRYCIPYIDIGFAITVRRPWDAAGPAPLSALPGNIFVGVPGGPCMWCADFLTKDKLAAETGGLGRSYLRDGTEGDAYVSSFNGVLANQAVNEVLQLLLGYSRNTMPRTYRRFDGMRGTTDDWSVSRKRDCTLCDSVLAAGDLVWQ
jgi:hypothetical protein